MDPIRIPLWNGSWTKNWVIEKVDIQIVSKNHDNSMLSDDMVNLLIATKESGALQAPGGGPGNIVGATLRDNRQVWWGTMQANMGQQFTLDPDHLFVDDLWLNGWYTEKVSGAQYALNQEIDYLITLRRLNSTIPQTVLSLIKEMAQDAPN